MSAKTRDELTAEEIGALPDGHPWKIDGMFSFGGLSYTPADDRDVEQFEAEQKQLSEKQKKARIEENYRCLSGVPDRYLSESLETFDVSTGLSKQFAEVRKFTESKQKSGILILCGNPGTGKTHLGCGIIRKLGGAYLSVQKLLYMIDSATSFRAKETKMDILDRLCKVSGVLVLDEVGRGVREDSMKELVGYLINERYSSLKKTVLISNLEKMELIQWLGLAVKDRLNETCTFVTFSGASYRLKKRAV